MKLHIKIKKYRKELKLSQNDLADLMQVSQKTISLWEAGKYEPRASQLAVLAQIFNTTTEELLSN